MERTFQFWSLPALPDDPLRQAPLSPIAPVGGWVSILGDLAMALELAVHRYDSPTRHLVFRRRQEHDRRRDFLDLRPRIEICLRHRLTVGRRIHDGGCDRVYQNIVLRDLLAERHCKCRDAGLRDRIGREACAEAWLQRMPCRDIDNATAGASAFECGDRRTAAQIGRYQTGIELTQEQRLVALGIWRDGERARDVYRSPELVEAAVEVRHRRLVDEVADSHERHFLVVR